MGRIDRAAAKMPSKGRPEMAARAHIKATEDPLGPDDFNVIDHRVWKRGRSQRTAEEMTANKTMKGQIK